ncbi:MAG: class I SAM-dependent methyltransferase [Arcobacteraceae bacterium]|nr:class I SAM-dependent methyltransferase [Arcobacteraceae bacterium]
MNGLNLYSKIEKHLDFQAEVEELYEAFLKICEELNVKKVIDIGCGQGEFLLSLEVSGMVAFGTDLSSEQVKVCKEKGLDVACIDISDVKEKFDCATAIFDVLNYMDKQILEKFVKDTYNLLEEGGYFIFDINTLYGFEEVAQGSLNINLADKFIGIDAFFGDKKLITDIVLFSKDKDGKYMKEEDFITQYYHEKNAIKKLLTKSGFDIKQIINFHLHSDDKADKLIFICQK